MTINMRFFALILISVISIGCIIILCVFSNIIGLQIQARQGDTLAQYNLGFYYDSGGGGLSQNYVRAVYWYRKAAEQGHASAQNNLGVCYVRGNGVPQSFTEAVKWYKLSANQGNDVAQSNLGNCYYNGYGIPQSYTEAVKWYKLSVAQGNAGGMTGLGIAYYNGKGIIRDQQKACQLFREAGEQGDQNAIDNYNKLCAPR